MSELLKRLPQSLYKYSSLSGSRLGWMRRLLLDSELYFPSSGSFNDPLDCRIPPCFDASPLKIKQHWRNFVRREFPSERLRNHKSHIEKLVRDSQILSSSKHLANFNILLPILKKEAESPAQLSASLESDSLDSSICL